MAYSDATSPMFAFMPAGIAMFTFKKSKQIRQMPVSRKELASGIVTTSLVYSLIFIHYYFLCKYLFNSSLTYGQVLTSSFHSKSIFALNVFILGINCEVFKEQEQVIEFSKETVLKFLKTIGVVLIKAIPIGVLVLLFSNSSSFCLGLSNSLEIGILYLALIIASLYTISTFSKEIQEYEF
jgi:hypothetical protein